LGVLGLPGTAATPKNSSGVADESADLGAKAGDPVQPTKNSEPTSNPGAIDDIPITQRPAGIGGSGTASEVPDLRGTSAQDVRGVLTKQGFQEKSISPDGYQRFKHPDGSEVWVNWNTGRVVRNAAPIYGPTGVRINKGQRLAPDGSLIPRNLPHDQHIPEFFKPN
jgi:hypothetical protein